MPVQPTKGFLSDKALMGASWRYLERAVARLLLHEGYSGVRVVGQSSDEGADILAHRSGKRWLVQVKRRQSASVGVRVIDETIRSSAIYRAGVPVVATNRAFTSEVIDHQATLLASGTPLQLWDGIQLKKRWERLPEHQPDLPEPRPYQESAVDEIVTTITAHRSATALIVMATGLGKTFVAAEALRRVKAAGPLANKVLVLAHTNDLVYQLERAFWKLLDKYTVTTIWNQYETPDHTADYTFACVDSVAIELKNTGDLPVEYDVIVIDECHHAGSPTYSSVIDHCCSAGTGGPFLLGLTATPWKPSGQSLDDIFGEPIVSVDIVEGLNSGWLCNVDYRMHVDNIDWDEIGRIHDLTPRGLNRTLFINEWDDAVVHTLKDTWFDVDRPRAIVFCGSIDHAITMRDRINALGFARAEALYSGARGAPRISHAQRSRILCDFHDGIVNVLCAVDILNEGVDLPDVNIVVFQRVTHSRRIFVQQLGRGLRIAEGKEKVVVLDFVSDIRRFAAGLDLKNKLHGTPSFLNIGGQVRFMNVIGEDKSAEAFLREWLEDVAAIESAGDDESILKFPPPLHDRETPAS